MATRPAAKEIQKYWDASGLARSLHSQFETARAGNDHDGICHGFYILTHYYARTILILRKAIDDHREPLARATMRNLLVLDAELGAMHAAAPDILPLALPISEAFHDRFVGTLIVHLLEDEGPTTSRRLFDRLSRIRLVSEMHREHFDSHLAWLQRHEVIERDGQKISLSYRPPLAFDADRAMLETLAGTRLARAFDREGYGALHEILGDRTGFIALFENLTGFEKATATLFVQVVAAFQNERAAIGPIWPHRDLIHSGVPRPYQLEAFEALRGAEYRAVVIDAPVGSGKTLIGMLCIEDRLQDLAENQSILVVVPTANYQQQWLRELCYNPIGLDLPPELVFAGTPSELERRLARGRNDYIVQIVTYTGLAQRAAAESGAFHRASIGRLLKRLGTRFVILDEVHKTVTDPDNMTAQVVRDMTRRLTREELDGVIGFSGTARAFSDKFPLVGLRLIYSAPLELIVRGGFVAPYSEYGIAYSYSAREHALRDALERYKGCIRRFLDLAGDQLLRQKFAAIPLDRRREIGEQWLNMYRGRSDRDAAAAALLTSWETGEAISLNELRLVAILQIATGAGDRSLAPTANREAFAALLDELEALRSEIGNLTWLESVQRLARVDGFAGPLKIPSDAAPAPPAMQDTLACTIIGLWIMLSSLYRRMGEGRVDTIRAVIEAEQKTRMVSGIILFDRARRIMPITGGAGCGYEGVAGAFGHLLGHKEITPLAALSGELYLPDHEQDLTGLIADFVVSSQLIGEQGNAIFGLLTAGLAIAPAVLQRMEDRFTGLLRDYAAQLVSGKRMYLAEFFAAVIRPVRREFGHMQRGVGREDAAMVRERFSRRNPNLRFLVTTLFDYARLALLFRESQPIALALPDGRSEQIHVIRMPAGRRRLLLYDLVARLADDSSVPINTLIVSDWARTGWNVIVPNVLIDATATRDPVAWQQLRGRAMRARRSWGMVEHRLLTYLLDRHAPHEGDGGAAPGDYQHRASLAKNDPARTLLVSLLTDEEKRRFDRLGLRGISAAARIDLACRLMLERNKVTHIYELLKATGATPQIVLDRTTGQWHRRESIARKHDNEIGIDLVSGELVSGATHAPIVFAKDPLADIPAELSDALATHLDQHDIDIVRGWLMSDRS